MEMSWPYALRSKFNPANSYDNIDYSMTSPLSADGSNYPCKGYQNDGADPVVSYTAGSTYNLTLSGTTTHEGGSCQISLSYDNGATFRPIKSMIGGCPLQSTYDFTIPSYMPAGNALLAWSWQNKVGNREFYMNCAEVSVEGSGETSTRKKRRDAATSFGALPYIWRANLEGLNDCSTTEGTVPVYPNPGPDVQYGDGVTSESPASSGDCDAALPYGQTYEGPGGTNSSASSSQPTETEGSVARPTYMSGPMYTNAPWADNDNSAGSGQPSSDANDGYTEADAPWEDETDYFAGPDFDAQARVLDSTTTQAAYTPAPFPTYSTMTVYADCPDTVTLTIYPSPSTTTTVTSMPSHYITSAACTGTSAACPCAQGFGCDEISSCTWACNAHPTSTAFSSRTTSWTTRTTRPGSQSTSTKITSRTHTVTPVKPSSTPPSQPTNRPAYATGDANSYLPCVPGTFICTSETTWETCNWNDDGTERLYGYSRDVAAGMMCLTNLSPYSGETDEYAQQALTPAGYYRDDRIVRERPDGDCDVDGSILCTDGGQQFDVCDHGGWVRMGGVAEGMTCRNGRIVES